MQQNGSTTGQPTRIRPTRLVRHTQRFPTGKWEKQEQHAEQGAFDITAQTTARMPRLPDTSPVSSPITPLSALSEEAKTQHDGQLERRTGRQLVYEEDADISTASTQRLRQLSGMLPAIRIQQNEHNQRNNDRNSYNRNNGDNGEDGWWPNGIQQTGALPVVNLYGREPFGRTLPGTPVTTPPLEAVKPQPRWKTLLNTPAAKVTLGLIIGLAMLYLVSRVVDIPATIQVIKTNLATPRGILLALLCGAAFLTAFVIRGIRWKLFLNPVGKVSTLKAIQLFLVGIFLNFALPVRGGEVAKSLMLKRVANIPISKSLPTVAMDKALDLMPALFIMVIVPFLGIHMDYRLWLILGTVGGLLIGLIFFVALAAWKRTAAIGLLKTCTGFLPKGIGAKIEGFATGFVDSLFAGASQPKVFLPAILLTAVAVCFDGLFAWLAFLTVGLNSMTYGQAIFGYTLFNMFYILPNPPGGVGSNELTGVLIFHGLLGFNEHSVLAMFVFSHPWTALLMCTVGMTCLSALGLNISSAMKVQNESEEEQQQQPAQVEQPSFS